MVYSYVIEIGISLKEGTSETPFSLWLHKKELEWLALVQYVFCVLHFCYNLRWIWIVWFWFMSDWFLWLSNYEIFRFWVLFSFLSYNFLAIKPGTETTFYCFYAAFKANLFRTLIAISYWKLKDTDGAKSFDIMDLISKLSWSLMTIWLSKITEGKENEKEMVNFVVLLFQNLW